MFVITIAVQLEFIFGITISCSSLIQEIESQSFNAKYETDNLRAANALQVQKNEASEHAQVSTSIPLTFSIPFQTCFVNYIPVGEQTT